MTPSAVLAVGREAHQEAVRLAAVYSGLRVDAVTTASEALCTLEFQHYDLVIAEHPPAGADAVELLDAAHRTGSDPLIVFSLTDGHPGEASRLVRMGAFHCVQAGAPAAELVEVLERAREELHGRRTAAQRNEEPWRNLLVGESPGMQDLARIIGLVARRRCTVMITGETGTGKEMAARAIHQASDRAQFPMVALNCSAIPEHLLEAELFGHTRGAFTGAVSARTGRFEEAQNGTLFLDEIGDMPMDLQSKLLRVLQERELQRLGSSETVKLNVRVIAASNVSLPEQVKLGRFREDLYYRLNVVPVQMPPLRDRPEDIRLLARHFVAKVCRIEGIPLKRIFNETVEHLTRHQWPGNVRELENLVEKAVVMSGDREMLLPSDFAVPTGGPRRTTHTSTLPVFHVPDQGIDFADVMSTMEKSILDQALQKARGNKTLAADLLRLKRTTLVSKLRVLEVM